MFEIAIGVLVALATLFLGLSIDFVLTRSTPRIGPTRVDFDLTGFDLPAEQVDLALKKPRKKGSEVDIDLYAMDETPGKR